MLLAPLSPRLIDQDVPHDARRRREEVRPAIPLAPAAALQPEPDLADQVGGLECVPRRLTRHLAGDYAPAVAKKQAEEPGWFSNWGGAQDGGPKFGSDGWWEKQTDALGG